jgi:hypothetical protein
MNLDLGIIVVFVFFLVVCLWAAFKLEDKLAERALQGWATVNHYQIVYSDVVAAWEKVWWQHAPNRGQVLYRVKFTDQSYRSHLWVVKVEYDFLGLFADKVEVILKQ